MDIDKINYWVFKKRLLHSRLFIIEKYVYCQQSEKGLMQAVLDQLRLLSQQIYINQRATTTNGPTLVSVYPTANKFKVTQSPDGFMYRVSGYKGDYPDVYLLSGTAYAFEINTPGNPFAICDNDTASPIVPESESEFTHISKTGVVTTGSNANIGHESGTLIWSVPGDVAYNVAMYRSLELGASGAIKIVGLSNLIPKIQ